MLLEFARFPLDFFAEFVPKAGREFAHHRAEAIQLSASLNRFHGIHWNNSDRFGTSMEQNRPSEEDYSVVSGREGNEINEIYGAGDGNRTHVRSLGKFN